ncbi:regulator of DNA class I crossover intermediates 1 isoform X1 [Engystomops pustulosus]|uniref:regulator of DNA class I crossover intermediates 1 isoform X1 n=1 Tax=Engystomops pustulosus TaxID=76066 RepID=UPI003AFA52BE
MNWVGGSRNRMIFKQERQKQREYFEKQKMKTKLKLLESSHSTNAALSLDLLNLQVINTISKKKLSNQQPQHVDICKRQETFSDLKRNIQLPMSPITTPSKICLDDTETISLTKAVEGSAFEDPNNYITEQDHNNEKIDLASSRNDLYSEAHKKRPELEPRSKNCSYDKCSDISSISLASENLTKYKGKSPLLHSAPHISNPRLFEIQDEMAPNFHKSSQSGKRDAAVQCNLEQEGKFLGHSDNN